MFFMWWMFALLSALFAALTAIFAKVGIKGVDTDLATAIRTVVILVIAWTIAFFRGGLQLFIRSVNTISFFFACLV
jgi:transporter family protein